MSARALLHDLTRQGVILEVQSGDLIVDGPAEALTDACVTRLRSLKPDLPRLLLGDDSISWDAEDWRAYFEERAAIREHDGNVASSEAERQALNDTIQHWLALHPPQPSAASAGCAHCGEQESRRHELLPVLTSGGHVWVHNECWHEWRGRRHDQARVTLQGIGITCSDPDLAKS